MGKSQLDKHVDIKLDRHIMEDVEYYLRQHSDVTRKGFFEKALRHELNRVHGDYSDPTAGYARLNQLTAAVDTIIQQQRVLLNVSRRGFSGIQNLLGSTGAGLNYLIKDPKDSDRRG